MKAKLLLLILILSAPVYSESDTRESDNLVDLYRTHRVVDDIESSLALYRDVLGLMVTEDRYFNSPKGASNEEATRSSRLVVLSNSKGKEILGLVHHIKPERAAIDISEAPFKVGTTTLIFSVSNLEDIFEKVKEVQGVKILLEPTTYTYPAYGGKNARDVTMSALQDPNGFAIEINQYEQSAQ